MITIMMMMMTVIIMMMMIIIIIIIIIIDWHLDRLIASYFVQVLVCIRYVCMHRRCMLCVHACLSAVCVCACMLCVHACLSAVCVCACKMYVMCACMPQYGIH
jgi:hypothetical protein